MEDKRNAATHVFYGVFVSTLSLIIASKAFPKVQSPILALDIILRRQRNDTLQFEGRNNVLAKLLPEEIIEMIKLELIQIELNDSEKELLEVLVCLNCSESHTYEELYGEGNANPECPDIQIPFLYNLKSNIEVLLEIKQFLASFGLHHVGEGIIGDCVFDLDFLAPIGLSKHYYQSCGPPSRRNESSPALCHAINTFSPSAFTLPGSVESIAQRFLSFSSTYQIQFKPHKAGTQYTQDPYARFENDEIEDRVQKSRKYYEIPNWQLWTVGSSKQ